MKLLILLSLLFSSFTYAEMDKSKNALQIIKKLNAKYKAQDALCDSLNLHIDLLPTCKAEIKKRIKARIAVSFNRALNQVERKAKDESECIQRCQIRFDGLTPPLAYNGSESCFQLKSAYRTAGNIGRCDK